MAPHELDRLLADIAELEAEPELPPLPDVVVDDELRPREGETPDEFRARMLAEFDALNSGSDNLDDAHWWDSARWSPPVTETEPVRPSYVLEDWEIETIRPAAPLRVWIGGRLIGVGGRR